MDASWIVWVLSGLIFYGAIRFLKQMPGAADFRMVAGGLAILGLVAAMTRADFRWHLLWFTPIALIVAYVYALRRLFALSHRVNKLTKSGLSDPAEIGRALKDVVDEYNRRAPEDQKMR